MPELKKIFMLMLILGAAAARLASAKQADLERDFVSPPAAVRPQTFWFWLCPTKEGITKDLEEMKAKGIGGYVFMNLGDASVWAKSDPFMNPKWHENFQFALAETRRLGLEAVIHNCDGFQEAGGPWVKADEAMKEVVWSKLTVQGGTEFRSLLPRPPAKAGFYHDVAVLAYRARQSEFSLMAQLAPKVTLERPVNQYLLWWAGNPESLPPVLDDNTKPVGQELMDGNPNTAVTLWTPEAKAPVSVRYEFEKPFTCAALSYYPWRRTTVGVQTGRVEASDDGRTFRKVCDFTVEDPERKAPLTVNFAETTAKIYRVLLTGQTQTVVVAELELLAKGEMPSWNPRIAWVESKAGLAPMPDGMDELPLPKVSEKDALRQGEMIDLTTLVDHIGRLEWTPPAGRWTILRLGYTITGAENHPASSGGMGWECDKLDKNAINTHLASWVGKMMQEQKALVGKTWKTIHADSWECGFQNWTQAFPEEFAKRRGYDLRRYLPVLAGEVVESPEISERFLQDFRRTIADLLAENYYEAFQEWCHKRGMTFEAEAVGPGALSMPPVDHLQCKGRTDMPMGEFHDMRESGGVMPKPGDEMCRDNKEAASAAHIYGKPRAGAEAFTAFGNWRHDPYWLKDIGDLAFCVGINRLVLHCSFQQPDDRKPGWVYPPQWGVNFHRNNTWWNQAGGWLQYLARCQALLQQGRFVGDVCLYYGEGSPAFASVDNQPEKIALARSLPPELQGAPAWDFDWCNAEVLLTRLSVKDGRLMLPDGMGYRILVLPNSRTMSLAVLGRIRDLAKAGATVLGPKPEKAPGLGGYPQRDGEVRKLAGELWGDCDGKNVKEHAYGKGRIIWGKSLAEAMAELGVKRDFEFSAGQKDANLRYIHRTADGAEIYFVANQRDRVEEAQCFFRVAGKAPELWHPDSGRIERPAVYEEQDGRTALSLRLEPKGSVFVVFRERTKGAPLMAVRRNGKQILPFVGGMAKDLPTVEAEAQKHGAALVAWEAGVYELASAGGKIARVKVDGLPAPLEVKGAWAVSFPPKQGAPEKATFDRLMSWTESAEEGVKYFSGTATYVKEFDLPAEMLGKDKLLFLDLGKVKNLATVKLNGQELGVLWKPPFRVELSRLAKAGRNRLEVGVTNMWVNRLIGDERLPKDKRITWTNLRIFYKADSPLLESGLLGPVSLRPAIRREVSF